MIKIIITEGMNILKNFSYMLHSKNTRFTSAGFYLCVQDTDKHLITCIYYIAKLILIQYLFDNERIFKLMEDKKYVTGKLYRKIKVWK